MLMYVIFILLPATALAGCERDIYYYTYNSLIPVPGIGVARFQYEIMRELIDNNEDGNVTKDDLTSLRVRVLWSYLIGREEKFLVFLNQGCEFGFNTTDIGILFGKIDTDGNGFHSRPEFDNYVNKYCEDFDAKECPKIRTDDNSTTTEQPEKE